MGGSTPNKPARRPAEMATADSPKDSEPPTVSGMPSAFYYITSFAACQAFFRIFFWIFEKSLYHTQFRRFLFKGVTERANAVHLLPSKNRLDKPEKIAYNKSKESTPVDGLLPFANML